MRRFNDPTEGIEIQFVQFTGIDMGVRAAVGVAATLGDAIGDVMLQTGGDALLLDSCRHLDAEFGDHEGVLPVAFQGPSPALVAGDVEDGRIDAVVAQQGRFFPDDPAGFPDQVAVPGGTDGDRGRKRRGQSMVQSMDAFVRKFHRNAKPGVFDEPPLGDMERVDMVREGVDQVGICLAGLADAVQLLVDVRQAVSPGLRLPGVRRKGVLQDAAHAVQGGQLASLFLERHLPQQVLDPVLQPGFRILENVHFAVFVEIRPPVVVDIPGGGNAQQGENG